VSSAGPTSDADLPKDRRVVLLNVRVDVLERIGRHLDDLVRECQLIEVGASQGMTTAPRVSNLAYGVLAVARVQEFAPQVVEAVERGADRLDLVMLVSAQAPDRVAKLRDLLYEAHRLQQQGMLLLPRLEPEMEDRLHWALDQVVVQVGEGAPPAAFDPATWTA
jgi:hypothetical protein